MIYIPAFLVGMLACWLMMRWEVKDLEFDKEMLLDFNEKQIRLIEELEAHETALSLRLFYLEHPELKEEWPEEVSFQ